MNFKTAIGFMLPMLFVCSDATDEQVMCMSSPIENRFAFLSNGRVNKERDVLFIAINGSRSIYPVTKAAKRYLGEDKVIIRRRTTVTDSQLSGMFKDNQIPTTDAEKKQPLLKGWIRSVCLMLLTVAAIAVLLSFIKVPVKKEILTGAKSVKKRRKRSSKSGTGRSKKKSHKTKGQRNAKSGVTSVRRKYKKKIGYEYPTLLELTARAVKRAIKRDAK